MINDYKLIVGLEIHVELKTFSKMFCSCKNDPFFAPKPNIYTCPVCLGMPGGIPFPNQKAIEWTKLLGLALNCEIPLLTKFDRKNYFYPDLAKGYQISQYDQPMAVNGYLEIDNNIPSTKSQTTDNQKSNTKRIRINRVHLEEDTGKLLHATVDNKKVTLVDFNRSGVPLVEIVTEPDIRSGEDAKAFLKKLHQIVRYLQISDADMEKGSMRLEPNISVKKITKSKNQNNFSLDKIHAEQISNDELPNYKVEVKNINSFNYVKKAIDYEYLRHIELLKQGITPVQETRGWNENKNITFSQRRKETADDYRYFPDPDIPPLFWTKEEIVQIRSRLPELPDAKKTRFMAYYEISEPEAMLLTETIEIADNFEAVCEIIHKQKSSISPKQIANFMINRKNELNNLKPAEVAQFMVSKLSKQEVNVKDLSNFINQVIAENPQVVAEIKKGKENSIMFLMGQVMKKLNGQGNPSAILASLKASLR